MASDTSDSVLTSADRKAIRAARGVDDGGQSIVILKSNGDSSFAKLKDSVFVIVVLFVGGLSWSQSISNAKLETIVGELQKTVAELSQEVKALRERIKP